MQGIFRKENTDKALKYGIYRHLPTYEKIIRNLVSFYDNKTFNDEDHEKAWILTVTANLSKNVLRSKSRQNLELDDTIKIVDNKFEKATTNHLDLEEAMIRLTANQRLVIYLFYYEQIPIKNIAKIMKSNENTVKSHLLRAKSKMKTYLEKE